MKTNIAREMALRAIELAQRQKVTEIVTYLEKEIGQRRVAYLVEAEFLKDVNI